MLTRRDNLLIRPWQQRRFENHRRKVQSALPAIDATPPPHRGHVCNKLKKKQSERERCHQIERDNLRLLQNMEAIMKKTRLDNRWRTPQPTFLHRVGIYRQSLSDSPSFYSKYLSPEKLSSSALSRDTDRENYELLTRKEKCLACHPPEEEYLIIDDRLLPWEQELWNKYIATMYREKKHSASTIKTKKQSTSSTKKEQPRSNKTTPTKIKKEPSFEKTPSVILTRGNLRIAVNFPPDTNVIFKDGNVEKVIVKDLCKCKNSFAKTNTK